MEPKRDSIEPDASGLQVPQVVLSVVVVVILFLALLIEHNLQRYTSSSVCFVTLWQQKHMRFPEVHSQLDAGMAPREAIVSN